MKKKTIKITNDIGPLKESDLPCINLSAMNAVESPEQEKKRRGEELDELMRRAGELVTTLAKQLEGTCLTADTCSTGACDSFDPDRQYMSTLQTHIIMLMSRIDHLTASNQDLQNSNDMLRLSFNRAEQGKRDTERNCNRRLMEAEIEIKSHIAHREALEKQLQDRDKSISALKGVITRTKTKRRRR